MAGLLNQPGVLVLEQPLNSAGCCTCGVGDKHYSVVTQNRAPLLKAVEELDCCCRRLGCICRRDFDLAVKDATDKPLYRFDHNRMCCTWCHCLACCRHRMTVVRIADKKEIGKVQNNCRLCCTCFPEFSVTNEAGHHVYTITKDVGCCAGCCGNTCRCCGCGCDVPVGYTIKGGQGGIIEKITDPARTGAAHEDTFAVRFPQQATDEERVLLVAATIVVDYTLYDEAPAPQKMK